MKLTIPGKTLQKVHFIGVGGISMSGLALLLNGLGYAVSGSDDADSKTLDILIKVGINILGRQKAENITSDIDLVVYTAAVKPDNPELMAAKEAGIYTMERAGLLGHIMEHYPYSVCVAGTHGKTSTTALVAEILLAAGLDPAISIGGYMRDGHNYRASDSGHIVLEACEFADQYHKFHPLVGIILNIDNDHMDYFKSFDNIVKSFKKFANNIKQGGSLIIYGGTEGFEEITQDLGRSVITYGLDSKYDFYATDIYYDAANETKFNIFNKNVHYTNISFKLPGRHNILNALGAAACCHTLGIASDHIKNGLEAACGVKRRFEHKGYYKGVKVVDDYAHHPEEIKPTLHTAKMICDKPGRVVCVFQPHNYSRTRDLMEEFAGAFYDADIVILLPIYTSREGDAGEVSSLTLLGKLQENGINAMYACSFDDGVETLNKLLSPGDLLLTMGAGDVNLLADQLLA